MHAIHFPPPSFFPAFRPAIKPSVGRTTERRSTRGAWIDSPSIARKCPKRERIFSQVYSLAGYPLLGGKRKTSNRWKAGEEAREAGRIDGNDERARGFPGSSARKMRVVSPFSSPSVSVSAGRGRSRVFVQTARNRRVSLARASTAEILARSRRKRGLSPRDWSCVLNRRRHRHPQGSSRPPPTSYYPLHPGGAVSLSTRKLFHLRFPLFSLLPPTPLRPWRPRPQG